MSNDMTTSCPQCGAPGKIGNLCEYCGAMIPMPVNNTEQTGNNAPFSWYNVCPQGYEPDKASVTGEIELSSYMVVLKKETRSFLKNETVTEYDHILESCASHQELKTIYKTKETYAIINREGKFIIDPQSSKIQLFTNNYDCIISRGVEKNNIFYYSIFNLVNNKYEINNICKLDWWDEKGGYWKYEKKFWGINDNIEEATIVALYDPKTRHRIDLNEKVPCIWLDFASESINENSEKWILTPNKYGKKYGIFDSYIIEITGHKGYVTVINPDDTYKTLNIPNENKNDAQSITSAKSIEVEKKGNVINKKLTRSKMSVKSIDCKKLLKYYFIVLVAWLVLAFIIPVLGPFWIMYVLFGLIFVPFCLIKIFLNSKKKKGI